MSKGRLSSIFLHVDASHDISGPRTDEHRLTNTHSHVKIICFKLLVAVAYNISYYEILVKLI